METELYKSRSYSACLKSAYLLFSAHFALILKRTWLPALLVSIVSATVMVTYLTNINMFDLTMSPPIGMLAMIGVADLLALVVGIWLTTSVVSLLNDQPLRRNLPHVLLLNVLGVIVLLLLVISMSIGGMLLAEAFLHMGFSSTQAVLGALGVLWLIALILGVVLLPCICPLMKYAIEPESKLRAIFGAAYRRAFRHWGFLFVTLFVTGILLYLIVSVLMIPLGIMFAAQMFDHLGMTYGDPSGVPSSFSVLLFGTSLVTFFVLTYLGMWSTFVLYYAYGSVEAIEQERDRNEIRRVNE